MTTTSRSLSSIHDAEAKLRQRVRKAHKTAARRLDEERRRLDEERARALEQAAIEDREAERQAREAAEQLEDARRTVGADARAPRRDAFYRGAGKFDLSGKGRSHFAAGYALIKAAAAQGADDPVPQFNKAHMHWSSKISDRRLPFIILKNV